MRYMELTLETPSGEIDRRCEELAGLGVSGFVIESEEDFRDFLENNRQYWDYVDRELEDRFAGASQIKFYLTDDGEGRALLERLQAAFPGIGLSYLQDSDWENNWRAYYKPIPTGEKLVVVPEWEEAPAGDRIPLRLDPGLIFGTGSHATTRMCLAALEEQIPPARRLLDLGCGSGILGIGGLLLGAEFCLGCDVDPKAPAVVMSNAALNGLDESRIRAVAGDVIADASLRRSFGGGYDLVLANIVADVIIPLAPHVPAFLKPGGVFICSGIIEGRQAETASALRAAGLTVTGERCLEDWYCFTAVRQP